MAELILLMVILGGLVISGGIGYWIGKSSGNGAAGLVLGVLFGPLGWLIAALVLKGDKRQSLKREVLPMRPVIDPVDAWERKEYGVAVPSVPEHLKGRKVED